jgi:hypothetical protein
MARQVLPIVGAVVGAIWFGNPQLGYAIGSMVGNAVDPQRIRGPRLREGPVQGFTEGGYRSVVYGVSWIFDCQVLEAGPIVKVPTEEQQGKGGGPVVEGERGYQTFAIGLGEPIAGIRVLRLDGKIVYDVRPGSTMIAASADFAKRFRFYSGAQDQLPDPDLEALPGNGVGNTAYYRGTSYLVFPNFDVTDLAGRIPTIEVEAVKTGTEVPFAQVDMEVFGSVGVGGGISSNWMQVYFEEFDAENFMAFLAERTIDPGGPWRARAFADSRMVFDSGWIGDTADQAELTAAGAALSNIRVNNLTDSTHVDISDPTAIAAYWLELNDGSILGPDPVEGTYSPAAGAFGKVTLYTYLPKLPSYPSTGGVLEVSRPDPADVPEPYRTIPGLEGVLLGQTTGTTYFTPFAEGVDGIDPDDVSLAEVIADICDRCGLSAGQLDLDGLSADIVEGVTLGGAYDGAGAITTLMPAFFFDLFEADHKIHFPKRGAAAITTITASDLIEEPDESILRGQDIEYPRALMLRYLDPDQNYAAPAATVQRTSPDIRVRGEAVAELPIAMSRTLAFRVADRMLKVMWEDLNGEVVFSLPAGPFAWLTPTDCLGLSLRGTLYRVRVEKVEVSAGVIKVTARRDRQSAYTSQLTPLPLPSPTPPPTNLVGATQFAVLNIPGIVDSDDPLAGVRVAACGLSGFAWTGCAVRLSSDGGLSYTTIATITTRGRIGNLLDSVASASPYYTDTTNVLRVLMLDSRELEAITDTQFLSDGNAYAISRSDGTAELGQFRDVVDEGDNEWSLSHLARGRLNTSAAAHTAGARFVMLSETVFVPLPTALIGQTLRLQFVSFGTSPEVAPWFEFTWSPAYSQTEFPVAELELERSGDDVTAVATPRHRFGTDNAPIASVNFEGFRWTATDGSNTATIDTGRTAPTTTFDCTGWATPITVTVAQINRITGPGPTISEQIA